MDFQKELHKIAEEIISEVDYWTWEAFRADMHLSDLDDETYLRFAKDAAQLAVSIKYNVPGDRIIKILMTEYEKLLKKYGYTDDMIPTAQYYMFREFLGGWITTNYDVSVDEGGPEEMPDLPEGDIDNLRMADIFRDLLPQPEVAGYLSGIDVNYAYEQFNMVFRFSDQLTHGSRYGFQRKHNFSARKTYNSLMEPRSLLWIAAALGEDPEVVKRAAEEEKTAKTKAEKSKIIRGVIPFERIYELALLMEVEEEDDI